MRSLTSNPSGASDGMSVTILFSPHRLTDPRQALRMAAGESAKKSHFAPLSSIASLENWNTQPMRFIEANSAATGPVTLLKTELLQLASSWDKPDPF